jgi:hypothetical protein
MGGGDFVLGERKEENDSLTFIKENAGPESGLVSTTPLPRVFGSDPGLPS